MCYTKVEDTNNYDNIYQSDLCGFTGSMGFEGSSSVYFANVYQGKNNEKLDAVGFYATSTDLEYEVFICENFESQESLNNRNHMARSGTIKIRDIIQLILIRSIISQRKRNLPL